MARNLRGCQGTRLGWAVAGVLILATCCCVGSADNARPTAGFAGQVELKTPLGMESLRNSATQFHSSDVSDVRRRAQLGDAEAFYFLGVMHYYGNAAGVDQNTDEAIRYFKLAADKDHLAAQVNLGMLLLLIEPSNSNRNAAQAVTYFTRAAEGGDSDAQWCLGRVYYEARVGRAPDYRRAAHWFKRSADAGNAFGLFHMGIMHEYGLGVDGGQDFVRAGEYYSKAADMENLDATYYLALLHAYGRGFPQDIHRASLLFKQAAERGHAPSQYYLGVVFLYGQGGFPRDYDMALYWMDRAARGPSNDTAAAAERAVAELRSIMEKSTDRMTRLAHRFADGPRGGPQESEQLFIALDTDGDGRVSAEEFSAKWHKPPAGVSFAVEDRDGDGFLSWEEFNGPNATTVVVPNASEVVSSMVAARYEVTKERQREAASRKDDEKGQHNEKEEYGIADSNSVDDKPAQKEADDKEESNQGETQSSQAVREGERESTATPTSAVSGGEVTTEKAES